MLPPDEVVREYFALEVVICVWELPVEMNVHEIEAVGLADTTQEMVTSCPETELYVFCWMFTVGRPEMYFALCWFI